MQGFARISAAVPRCRVADFSGNAQAVAELWRRADQDGSAVVVFPELCLSAYTSRDLLLDQHLQAACVNALAHLAGQTNNLAPLALVGMPLRVGGALYNVAVALQGGRPLAVVAKSYLPTYREFEEARWFRSGLEIPADATVALLGEEVPFGTDVLLRARDVPDLILGLTICEDEWVHLAPSAYQVSAGATVICTLSASNFIVGKAEHRRLLVRAASDRGKCAHVYVGAGPGESSTDLAFDADAFVCENGRELDASERFSRDSQLITVDIDLERLIHERVVTGSFNDCAQRSQRSFRTVPFVAGGAPRPPLRRRVDPHPFLPKDAHTLATRCWEIFEIQTNALVTRMRAARVERLVLGVSGGVDSTQAALVGAVALDLQGLPRENLRCLTMPGLGTSPGTRGNAERLARSLGASFEETTISEMTRQVLASVRHAAVEGAPGVDELVDRLRENPDLGDIALENVQARLRTLILMTLANQDNALVLGTGDLSEKALGWSTYAGDHIAMYDVNAGVPKTLIQFVIRWVANERARTWTDGDAEQLRATLFAILDTPISPELLPAGGSGAIAQSTEAVIGPYELHDFFLYHFVRHGARPHRVLDLAREAFSQRYAVDDLKQWLRVFLERFFRNQFKRSCTADGPKVGMVALSPRGDWRMPSDADATSWVREVDDYRP